MYLRLLFLIAIAGISSCQTKDSKVQNRAGDSYKTIFKSGYHLHYPAADPRAVLVLFGGYPENAEAIKREFPILEKAERENIAVLYSNYNRKLWFEAGELAALAQSIDSIFTENELSRKNVYFGGFSSGGNVALLLSNHLVDNSDYALSPAGVFVVDSPLDLAKLHETAETHLQTSDEGADLQESQWLVQVLGNRFGHPDQNIEEFAKHSVVTLQSGTFDNLRNLETTQLRLYTEPDTIWWQENRQTAYRNTNAYVIKKLDSMLDSVGYSHVEYVPTKGKGFRANGIRHPHSWSIVDQEELIQWIID